ncbi:acyl carrier protein [Phytohabitans rumicis]|uniref:Phosphopantetheine attachment site domain protein n=1 Tax=Phytohabitans rumicis TaxID=1076125 RepID=A0A6V8KNL4_9ACTN|nr:acyl carrier protein [Phytohabitans rumicis]GFJ86753.1 phosphopantetheine attachment site domain protein [Phytohabitans rumicis]
MKTNENRPTAEHLRPWLVERVAEFTERDPATIDPAAPLAGFGLDSVYALALCGEIEDHLGVTLEPTIVWDHPSVDALVAFLCEVPAGTRP